MKKMLAILVLLALTISCACAENTEVGSIDLSAMEIATPNNQLTEDFEQEGSEGKVIIAEQQEEPAESAEVSVEPFVPDNLNKAVIGADDRVQVTDTKQYPYSAIANMKVTGECGCRWECTGFMVGKRYLMTAAHCMICTDHNRWAKNITFYFGYRSNSNYLYKYTGGWSATAGTDFPNGYVFDAMENDWCFVRFDKKVGEQTGWIGFNVASDNEINSRFYQVTGYRDNKLKYAYGFASVYDNKLIIHTVDEVSGNSGGPIYLYNANNYDATRADAIIVAESLSGDYNIGRRITNNVWNSMKKDGYE